MVEEERRWKDRGPFISCTSITHADIVSSKSLGQARTSSHPFIQSLRLYLALCLRQQWRSFFLLSFSSPFALIRLNGKAMHCKACPAALAAARMRFLIDFFLIFREFRAVAGLPVIQSHFSQCTILTFYLSSSARASKGRKNAWIRSAGPSIIGATYWKHTFNIPRTDLCLHGCFLMEYFVSAFFFIIFFFIIRN